MLHEGDSVLHSTAIKTLFPAKVRAANINTARTPLWVAQ